MKSTELRELTKKETEIKLIDSIEEQDNLRFQHSLRQLENEQRIKVVRREIAQLKTLLQEEKLGSYKFPGTVEDEGKESKK
ncbi:MAG: 50S ribosomal protein L29 [Candidatus Marinimicrobia bacterium]|nr:50S ribosomal protein L29 [Candidatus Neomarinimicrobiota bacterium]